MLPYYAGAAGDATPLRPNHGLYLNVLRFARRAGFTYYDFGRSKRGTGSYAFKKHWGFEPEPLHYAYPLLRATEMPAFNPTNPKYRAAIALWRRLPLGVANFVGPFIARDLA